MQCPSCGLYHPSRYEQCVSCGSKLRAQEIVQEQETQSGHIASLRQRNESSEKPKFNFNLQEFFAKLPKSSNKTGLIIMAAIFLATAGGTYFFLSRPAESDRLLEQGQKELANGQYAFAQKTLEKAVALKPTDPKLFLNLARSYIGTDQLEKAWSCISQAQQLGTGLMSDPELSTELANYYRQKNQYQRAAELLRPFSDKKVELADLDALWGDESFRQGDIEQAMKCWEEVRDLNCGSRMSECDTRLATIYQKMANIQMAKNNNEGALNYLAKLNNVAPNPQSYEKTSDLYAQLGKTDLAIDQLKRAIKSGSGSVELNNKLASLMLARGKELIDAGDTDTGYGYIQQAKSLDTKIKVSQATLRSVKVAPDGDMLVISGEIWNPGASSINYLVIKSEITDSKTNRVLATKEQRVIDEFEPPLGSNSAKPFSFTATIPDSDGEQQLKLSMNGIFYRAYSIQSVEPAVKPAPTFDKKPSASGPDSPRGAEPPVAPQRPEPAAPPALRPEIPATPGDNMTPEERTMKELE
ncbi:MAG: tetratricopeptide repeat protein [Candidatus Obscuribacterales bacterium]|nr:tetratricopeptide repeat protein [Candidatus Obscuribacterales bacterium]